MCRCEANYILMINTMLLALCMFVIPFCQVLPALAFVLAVMGFNMGSVDTLANLQMITVFGDAVPPFLQVRNSVCNVPYIKLGLFGVNTFKGQVATTPLNRHLTISTTHL